ncbi:MAG TPA: TraR/DksA C4-type zinc finger protein [Mycobacteriales bacterium]|nr:TraR/DksA C4-type zinc finger protein [Mycobacteriales bacterium]
MEATVARSRLEQLLAELEASLETVQHAAGDPGELTTVDQHPADSGTNLVTADREEATIEIVRAQQERVREALARIEAGTYGRCVDCGAELPEERLEARPEAARCVDCQQRAEAGRPPSQR